MCKFSSYDNSKVIKIDDLRGSFESTLMYNNEVIDKKERKENWVARIFCKANIRRPKMERWHGIQYEQHEILSKLLNPSPRQLTIQCDHSALRS